MQARARVKTHEMDLTIGPILKKIIIYALPLICTNVLQVLFNAADLAVLGTFSPNATDVGAVGATNPLIQLIISLFVGLSSGASVVIAKYAGAGTLVPVTGFSNAVVSEAMDSSSEGLILGVGAKIFNIAGPVILFGLCSGILYGIIYYISLFI